MNDPKPPLFPHIKITTDFTEKTGNRAFASFANENQYLLYTHIFEYFYHSNEYSILQSKIEDSIDDPRLQDELMQDWSSEVYQDNHEVGILINDAKLAYLYVKLSEAAANINESEKAWALNTHATFMIGALVERSEAVNKRIDAISRSKQNRENAKGRNKSFLPVKKEAAILLHTKRPERGWKTLVSAVAALEGPLANFIIENNIGGLSPKNIGVLLEKTWIRDDELVHNAWLKNKHPLVS